MQANGPSQRPRWPRRSATLVPPGVPMTSLRPLLSLLFLPALLWAQNRGATAEAAAPAALIDDSTIAAIKSEGLEHSEAMRLLRDLTKMGHRLTGSDNFTVACDWTAAEFSKMGLKNVHKEK